MRSHRSRPVIFGLIFSLLSLISVGTVLTPQVASASNGAGKSIGSSSSILEAASYPAIESVLVKHPLPNFSAAVPGPSNGPLTAAQFGALSSDPLQAEARFNELADQPGFGAYVRLWSDTIGPGKGSNDVVVTLYRISSLTDAASFASGAQQPFAAAGTSSKFEVPSIPGAHGYTVSVSLPTQVTEQVVLFRSGPYVAIVQLASSISSDNPAVLHPSDAITVSFQQYVATQHAQGLGFTESPLQLNTAGTRPGEHFFMELVIVLGLAVLVVVGWLANRRRRASSNAIQMGPQGTIARARTIRSKHSIRPTIEPVVIEPVVIEPVVIEPVVIEPVVLEPVVQDAWATQTLLPSSKRVGTGTAATPVGRLDIPAMSTAPAWLPDPSGSPNMIRYWDGNAWTTHVATRSTTH